MHCWVRPGRVATSGVAVDRLLPLGGQKAGVVQHPGEVELAGADLVALGAVHPRGRELQVGDGVVQFGADGAGNDGQFGKTDEIARRSEIGSRMQLSRLFSWLEGEKG